MSKPVAIILTVFIFMSMLTGCNRRSTNWSGTSSDDQLSKDIWSILNMPKNDTTYLIGTDFGGDYAAVGGDRYPQRNALVGNFYQPYIIINKKGQEVFRLPDGITVAGAWEEQIPPIGNYIFASNSHSITECIYVYNTEGDLILSAEQNNFTKILTGCTNFRQMAADGFLPVRMTAVEYTGTTEYFGIMDFNGEMVFEYIPINGWGVDHDNIYYGDGIFYSLEVNYIDLKNKGTTSREIPRDVPYLKTYHNGVADEHCGLTEYIFELESHASLGEYYQGKVGVIYNEAFSDDAWFSVVDEKGNLLFDPVKIDSSRGFKEIYIHDKGILIQDNKYRASFYDFSGNYIKSVELPDDTIHEFSSGYFNIGANYLDSDGNYLFS